MTTDQFIKLSSAELKKGLKSVIRKANRDQRALMEKYRRKKALEKK